MALRPREGHLSIFIFVLLQLVFNVESQIPSPNGNILGRDYNTEERNTNSHINSGSTRNPFNGEILNSKQTCNSVQWPMENYVSGPFAQNVDVAPSIFAQLCPAKLGIFQIPTTCELFIICHNGCLTINRCPPLQYFHPERRSCIPDRTYNCSASYQPGDQNTIKGQSKIGKEQRVLLRAPTVDDFVGIGREAPGSYLDQKNSSPSVNHLQLQPPSPVANQINCIEEQDGLFAHPTSCDLFIRCANGNQLVQKCPPGTVFNSNEFFCDWRRNVPQCSTERDNWRLQPFINSASRAGAKSTDLYGNRAQHSSSKRSPVSPKKSKLCTPSTDFIEPHAECNKYQVCSNGRLFIETCGPGTHFDPLNSVCNFPDKVDCESRKADLGTYGCEKKHSYRTSHWEFCNQFVECDHGVLAIKMCPSGLVFDVETNNCDYAFKIECRKPISLEHDTDVNPRQPVDTRSTRSISNYMCEYNYIAPHPRCNKFVECEEKRLFVKSCGPGTVYNMYLGQCDWSYNTREADDNDCSAYQQCQGGEWKGRVCNAGLLFSPVRKRCERPENVECNIRNSTPKSAESK